MIVVQFCGFSRSGKTAACLRLAPLAAREGTLAYIKHHHAQIERPGSNTEQLADYASLRLLAGSDGSMRLGAAPSLEGLLAEAKEAGCGIALVEGFKESPGAKTWLRRDAADAPPAGVRDVALDLVLETVLELEPALLWQRVPRRFV